MAGFDNDVVYASNYDFSGGSPVVGKSTADGMLPIGSSVAPFIRAAVPTSTGGTITFTFGHGTINMETAQKDRVIAYRVATITNATGDGTGVGPVIFDGTTANVGGHYNTATGIYTAPRTGQYAMSCNIMFMNLLPAHNIGELVLHNATALGDQQIFFCNPGLIATTNAGYTNATTLTLSGSVQLTAGDQWQINVVVDGSTKTVSIAGSLFALETSLSITEL